ncbi:cytochrome c [Microbacteriaceae bacterium K1510]|nr:cytochrome c [Microbacteriaceae bacterium K1510]
MSRLICALFGVCLLLPFTQAASAANAANGERLARRWCAACHIVAADQNSGSTQAPPFSAVAKRPDFDASKLALFLLLPHPRMPDMNMSRDEAADLAAYIASQGR